MVRFRRKSYVAEPAKCDWPDVGAVRQFVSQHDFLAHVDQRRQVVGNRHAINQSRVEKTSYMVSQSERFRTIGRLVDANSFKYGRSIMQGVRHDVYCCLFPWNHPAVMPDQFSALKTHLLQSPDKLYGGAGRGCSLTIATGFRISECLDAPHATSIVSRIIK